MRKIAYSIKSWITEFLSRVEVAPCNYDNNYYADQICGEGAKDYRPVD